MRRLLAADDYIIAGIADEAEVAVAAICADA